MPRERFEVGRLRERWDEATRTYTTWDASGAPGVPRLFTPAEAAAFDAEATARNRENNRILLLDRVQAALAANSASLQAAQTIQSRTVWTNNQRDDALRFLAGRVIELAKQNNDLIRLVVGSTRADVLDSTA